MSIAPRDREALELVASRSFAGAFVASLALDMQARRLTVRLYGTVHGDAATYLATLTFFGTSALGLENADHTFPQSVRLASLALTYGPSDDEGHLRLTGTGGWSLDGFFDGLAYEEQAAVLASLADDL